MSIGANDPLAVLQRIRESRPRPAPEVEEACELCSEPIAPVHNHLVDLRSRTLLCACRGCYLLFESDGAGGDHYRSVPDRYLSLAGHELTPAQWDRLQIPVSVAFFFLNSSLQRVAAFYPGPAGATESELPLDAWDEVVGDDPLLASMQPDVEAFLVRSLSNRRGQGGNGSAGPESEGTECYVVPIDACYELVGHLRLLWRGFDGGTEANKKLDEFFDDVRARAK
ncbi:MAG TPA: DUF5947 family protein [Acidimicrobiales bacterium]|nr:DUF5947 family protein [Acidimicrobiales bacterium]